jgi:hypothetical protein
MPGELLGRVTEISGMFFLDVVVLWLLWVVVIFLGLLWSLHVFGFFYSLLLAKMFVAGPVLSLVLSATIDHLLATATGALSFLQTHSASAFQYFLRAEIGMIMNEQACYSCFNSSYEFQVLLRAYLLIIDDENCKIFIKVPVLKIQSIIDGIASRNLIDF